MLLKNNDARLHTFAFWLKTPQGNPYHGHVSAIPGVNRIDNAQWEQAKKSLAVQALLSAGNLEEYSADHPKELPEREALLLIGETNDEALIQKWFAEDARPNIRASLLAQAEKLDALTAKSTGKS